MSLAHASLHRSLYYSPAILELFTTTFTEASQFQHENRFIYCEPLCPLVTKRQSTTLPSEIR